MSRARGVAFATSVFSREAVRTARRWQTWVLRALFAALLFAVVLTMWTEAFEPLSDPADGATIGMRLFKGYVWTQITLVAVLAPILVGQGILEERDESTLELLAMTHLSPGQILWGKVLSRLAVLGTLVLASTPLLAASTTFGGVGPWQVVNAVVNTLVVLVVLGALGGLFALIVDNTVGVMLAVATWFVPAIVVVPVLYGVVVASPTGSFPRYGALSPLFGAIEVDARGLLPAVASACVLVAVARWAGPLFAIVATDPDDSDHRERSPEAARVVWRTQRAGWTGLATVVAGPVTLFLWLALDGWGSTWTLLAQRAALWSYAVLVVASGTDLLVLAFLRVGEARRYLAARRARAFAAVAAGRAEAGPTWVFRGRVVGHPIVWRELVTNGLGFSSVVARWAYPAWLVVVILPGLALLGVVETVGLLTSSGLMLGGVMTMSVAVETIAAERRQRTLELLAISTMTSTSIAAGKLASVLLLGGPYVATGVGVSLAYWVVSTLSAPTPSDDLTQWARAGCGTWTLAYGNVVLKAALVSVWAAIAWLAVTLAVMVSALWVHPPRLAWVAIAVLCLAVPTAIGVAGEVLPDPLATAVPMLALPIEVATWEDQCGTSPWLLESVVVYALASGALFLACSASIRLVVRRDAR